MTGRDDSARKRFALFATAGAIVLMVAWAVHLADSRGTRPGGSADPTRPDRGDPPGQASTAAAPSPSRRPVSPEFEPAEKLRHSFAVVDLDGNPVTGARILVTDQEVFGDLDAVTLAPQLHKVKTFLDAITGDDGELSVELDEDARVYVRCVSASGLRVAGPRFVEVRDGPPARTRYVSASILAGAILLADGAAPLYVDWALPSAFQIAPKATRQLRDELAARLGLDRAAVMTVVPAALPDDRKVPIAVCHPRVGWFRAHAAVLPAEELRTPTLVDVPASGETPPVRVTVRCVDPRGERVDAEVRLMGGSFAPGSQQGWPRFGLSFPANQAQLFPPGLLEASFVDASLMPFSRKRVQVDQDTTITLEAPFTPRRVALTLISNGEPFRGRVAMRMKVEKLGRDLVIRSLGCPDGVMTFSAPTELACDLYLRCSEGTAEAHVAPSKSTALVEQVVVFQ
jgi:hypothetical protein